MDVPKYQHLLWPAAEAMRELGGSGTISEINETIANNQGFTEEQQSVLHGDGPGSEINYRIAWARSYLKGMGLATNPDRGVWALTATGREITEDQIEPLRVEFVRNKRTTQKTRDEATEVDEINDEAKWQDTLLERLLDLDPAAFERLCRHLLRRAGFIRTQVTGKTSDGGIDGVGVYRMSLVSFPVFFQAKRWRNSVGSAVIRDFRGAMAGRGEKGLLITTSTFTAEAKAEASRDGAPPVDLIDGAALCDLLVEYEIGVTVTKRTVLDVTIDEDKMSAI